MTEMTHMEMKNPEQKHVVISTRKPLQNSMIQQTSADIMPSNDERLENAKLSSGRRKGRRRGKGAKVEQLQEPKLDLSMGSHDSSKGLVFHRRPGYGQLGRKCMVKANHFLAQVPDTDLSQYSVSSLSPTPEFLLFQVEGNAWIHLDFKNSCNNLFFFQVTITPEVASRKINKSIMAQLVKLHRDTDLGMRLPVYDGKKVLYTAGLLPFVSKEFAVRLAEEDEGTGVAKYVIHSFFFVILLFCSLDWSCFIGIYSLQRLF